MRRRDARAARRSAPGGGVPAPAAGGAAGQLTAIGTYAEAHARGPGTRFDACFNSQESEPRSPAYRAEVTVRHLSDGHIIGRTPGSRAGMAIDLGATAVLDLGELQVVVISRRQQCIDPGYFENFGLDVPAARTVVVKSRGHVRAGFSVYFQPDTSSPSRSSSATRRG